LVTGILDHCTKFAGNNFRVFYTLSIIMFYISFFMCVCTSRHILSFLSNAMCILWIYGIYLCCCLSVALTDRQLCECAVGGVRYPQHTHNICLHGVNKENLTFNGRVCQERVLTTVTPFGLVYYL
jgi:hypothetical protein